MKINITKKQYRHLLDLIYLGEWTMTASEEKKEQASEHEAVAQYIYSFAKDFGYDDLVSYEKSLGGYFPTRELEEKMDPIIDANDEEVFWLQLSGRLSERDVARQGGKLMTSEARLRALFEAEEKYEEEFSENGLANVVIKKDDK